MIHFEKTYQHLNLNTFLDPQSIYFVEISEEETPHRLGFDIADYYSEEILEKVTGKVLPLGRLNAGVLAADLPDNLPLFYHEFVHLDLLVSHLDDAGKVTESYFLDYNGERHEFEDQDEEEGFEEGVEEIQSMLEEYEGQFLNIMKETPAEAAKDWTNEDSEEYGDWCHQNAVAYGKTLESFDVPDVWGPLPWQMQANFRIPVLESTGEQLKFLGQFNSGLFDLADFEFYVFFAPKEKIIVQVIQMT